METITMTCQVCPNQCQLAVQLEDDEITEVTGNGCMKGYAYAAQEAINRKRGMPAEG